ncbi:LDL receptor domain-containing protein [Myxococcota bacterium]|nr:LDL receptor domain-containing protein [Myxococcota bacterium]MBU1380699.1 LDL receptor domain-containing protein [Myxococcota bacterium]MBU1495907.1 LDL receptor domain-containing protein [Myxococcota bacterium]
MKTLIISVASLLFLMPACDDDSSSTPTGTEIATVICDKLVECDPETTTEEYNECMNEFQPVLDINPPQCRDAGWDLAMCIDSSSCEDLQIQGTCGSYYAPLAAVCTEEICGEDDYECSDGECISNDFLCDGECDCNGCEDESTCDAAKK